LSGSSAAPTRRLCAIPMLLSVLVAFAEADDSRPAHVERLDPCLANESRSTAPASWSAKIRRDNAINVIRHVRNACRIINQLASSQDEKLRPRLNSVLENVRDEILAPIYRTYPSLARTCIPNDVHPNRRPTRRDIDRVTATRLDHARVRVQQEINRLADEVTERADSRQSAEAALQPFVDASVELAFAWGLGFEAHPDIWAKNLPDQPRTPESDASFRQSALPLGSVKLSPSA
jgi:hypothetical protein